MNSLPTSLIEGSNAALAIMLLWVILLDVLYLLRKAWELRTDFLQLYREFKAAFALLILLTGFEIRTGTLWWFRWMESHGGNPYDYKTTGINMVAVSSLVALWGAACWLRATSPSSWPPGVWALMTATAIIGGTLACL